MAKAIGSGFLGNCGYRADGITSVETSQHEKGMWRGCSVLLPLPAASSGALAAKICEINRVEIVQNGFSNSKSRRGGNERGW